jgi:hypothetical protein
MKKEKEKNKRKKDSISFSSIKDASIVSLIS